MNGTLIGLTAVAIWVLTTVLVAYISTVPPLELSALIFFFGYISMTAVQIWRKEDIKSYWTQPLSYYIFWLSTAGFYTILIFSAYRSVPMFEANILNHLWPVMLIGFAALLNKETVTPLKFFGSLIGFVGAVAVFLPSENVGLFEDFHWGHGFALGSATMWALYSAMAKNKHYPVGFLGPVFLVFAVICAGFHFIFEETINPRLYEWIIIGLLGFFRIAYALWDYGMKHGDVILLASASYFLPLLTSVFLILFGFSPERPMIALGAALIILGCLTVNFDQLKLLLKRTVTA